MAQALSFLDELVGRQITLVSRVLYLHDGEIEPDDGPVEVGGDGYVVLLDGASDGESLRARREAWKDPFEGPLSGENELYVEKHGKWQRVDYSQQEPYAGLVGQRISEIVLLTNEHGRVAGIRLSVPGRTMWFVVEGDECHVRWAHPSGFTIEGEKFKRSGR